MRVVAKAVIVLGVLAGVSTLVRAGESADGQPRRSTARPRGASSTEVARVVATYCAGCHNGVTRSPSGAVLDRFDPAAMSSDREMWSRAYRQVQAGTMPPAGARRPDRPASERLLASIQTALGADGPPPSEATSREIADRLAGMLWNSEPDDLLLADVRSNALAQPAVVERQVARMLADQRAAAFVSSFLFPWLGLDQLGKAEPDLKHFPDYDVTLRDSMATETELFLRSQLRDNADPLSLWTADYTFLNEQLARHYGVTGVRGAQFRRVTLTAPERRGLLGQGSILMLTSRHQHGTDAGYTSPAARSMWIRLHFLGASAPRPFPGAQPVRPDLPITPQTRTLPAEPCGNCHRNFFPLGYALENFDPIGRWRTADQIGLVDVSGTYVDGTPTNGIVQLREVLLRYPEAARTTVVEKLLVYAAGRPVSGSRQSLGTLVHARQVLHATPAPRWSSLIAAIVRMKSPLGEEIR